MPALTEERLRRLGEAMATDPELQVIGKFFNARFLLQADNRRYLLVVRDGWLHDLRVDPPATEGWSFAIKAPDSTWESFLESPPKPMFHDIWAAAWMGHLMIEGDTKVLMQQHNALWRTLELLRELASGVKASV
jgi:hypothetical protein